VTVENQQDCDSSKSIQRDGPAGNLLRPCVRFSYRHASRVLRATEGAGWLWVEVMSEYLRNGSSPTLSVSADLP